MRIFICVVIITTFVLRLTTPILASDEQAATFSDVPDHSWASDAISSAVENGLMSGMGDGVFGYGETITRAQFVTILSNMFGWQQVFPSTATFADVSARDWFYTHVEMAAAYGVADTRNYFNPNAPILRQDMAVMLVRALGYSELAMQAERFEVMPFSDVNSHEGYIIIAHDIGMISGIGEGQFAPFNTATREQAAAMITRVYNKLNAPLQWVHGFYAFASFHQRELIRDMDAVSFGWSQMEWSEDDGARLNTTSARGNPWVIPSSYELIANFPRESGARTHLNVFADATTNLHHLIVAPEPRNQAVSAIMHEATRIYEAIGASPFDGVTINFEGLRGEAQKAGFNIFLTELAQVLRAANLTLYVTVHPSTIDGIYFDGYDFRTIGELADRVILMAHDYHPRSLDGLVGTAWQRNAALTPIAEVYRSLAAITHPITGVQDRSRIAIAFSFPNIGWFVDENGLAVSPTPVTVSNETVIVRMSQPDTHHGWSDAFRNPYIIYTTESGQRVFLWHEDHRSVYEKLRLARLFGITGASVWRIGIIPNEEIWDVWDNFVR